MRKKIEFVVGSLSRKFFSKNLEGPGNFHSRRGGKPVSVAGERFVHSFTQENGIFCLFIVWVTQTN